MKHYGDISKISGYEIELVDCVTGGSPCQDLSIAGKRAGLSGERSSLFMEQIRVVKELRDADRKRGRTGVLVRPRYMVWENVPGAFSSNSGKDFQAVLTETIRIAEPEAPDVPLPEKGKWPLADAYYGDGWSVAYRVLDAQFWGVAQRRRRIALVADFGGLSATEILFVRDCLHGDFAESGTQREGAAGAVESGAYPSVARSLTRRYDGSPCIDRGPNIVMQGALNPWDSQSARVYSADGVWHSMNANENGGQSRDAVFCLQGNCVDRDAKQNGSGISENVSATLNATDRHAVMAFAQNQIGEVRTSLVSGTLNTNSNATGRNSPLVYDARGNGDGKTVCTLTGDHQNRVTDYTALCVGNGQLNQISMTEQANTLDTMHGANDAGTQNKVLRLLRETYGEEKVLQWGVAVMATLQQADLLREGVHESGISGEAENWNELDDGTLPCPELIAEWMLRDMWKREERRCTPQGRKSAEQRFEQSDEGMPELPQQNPQTCAEMFDMWRKGQGIGLLQQTLYKIQEIWKSVNVSRSVVRRLTPLEAERLQGYPDGWTDIGDWIDTNGKKHKTSDSARYRALGNSIALPPWKWVLKRISAQYERDATLGSLFDGISGFPLIWEQINGRGSALWASEIEEFCIEIAKKHFGNG